MSGTVIQFPRRAYPAFRIAAAGLLAACLEGEEGAYFAELCRLNDTYGLRFTQRAAKDARAIVERVIDEAESPR
jgi:hypothetical protein